MATTLDFDPKKKDRVALIVRGKTSATHEPGVGDQHADVILYNGAPMGYFGEGAGASGYLANPGSVLKQLSGAMSMDGKVYDYNEMTIKRPHYVDGINAKTNGIYSTVLVIEVTPAEAAEFTKYWTTLSTTPPTFRIVGKNCSTRASEGFIRAGIVKGGIPGLDTPNNLYKQLVKEKGKKAKSYSGFLDFQPTPGGSGKYTVTIEEVP